jgi:multidrug efflux pump subunit AcrB
VILGAVCVVVVGLVTMGGLFAMRSLRAAPAPDVPVPTRVVKVNVQPEG